MRMYLANTTKQDHRFTYRLPGASAPHQRTIPAGRQIELDLVKAEHVSEIVKQHERYNMQETAKLSRRKGFVGLCWSTEPIDIDEMLTTYEINDKALNEDAQDRRELAAAAMSRQMQKDIAEKTGKDIGPPSVVAMETRTETGDEEEGTKLAVGVEVPGRPGQKSERVRR